MPRIKMTPMVKAALYFLRAYLLLLLCLILFKFIQVFRTGKHLPQAAPQTQAVPAPGRQNPPAPGP